MRTSFAKRSLIILTVALPISLCAVLILSFKAYAFTLTEWRPSVEIKKELAVVSETLNKQKAIYDENANFIEYYENESDSLEDDLNYLQSKADELDDFVKNERPELEELTKNSYAAYFAKYLMDDIVGSKIVTEGIFHWGLVTFIACGEDEEVINFIEDYYTTKNDLDKATYDMENATATYQNAVNFVNNYSANTQALNDRLNYLNEWISQIYEIESVYGAAGESRIEGENVFCHPCPEGTLSAPFGEEREGYVHHGMDISASEGSPIYAACDGFVLESGENETMGNYIKIKHEDGLVTVYMHCSKLFVPAGLKVYKGDNIALVGSTGNSTGPHLHFQVELNGNPVNGKDYL